MSIYMDDYQWERHLADRERQHRLRVALAELPPGPCAYCGAPDAPAGEHVDGRAGPLLWDLSNIVRSCIRCNSSKGARSAEEWKAWRLLMGMCWPPRWDVRPRRVRIWYALGRWQWECTFCEPVFRSYRGTRTWRRARFSALGHLKHYQAHHEWVITNLGPETQTGNRRSDAG